MAARKSFPRPWRVEFAGDAFIVVGADGSAVARIVIDDRVTRDCAQAIAKRMVESAERLIAEDSVLRARLDGVNDPIKRG